MNRLRTANVRHVLRWAILAWTLLFACSQVLASNHIHLDTGSDVTCTICAHGHDTPISGSDQPAKIPAAHRCGVLEGLSNCWVQLDPPSSYQTRAPPLA